MIKSTQEAARLGKFFYAMILPEGKPLPALVGLDEKNIQPIPYQDIAAVVSDHPVTTIKPLRKNLLPYHQVTKTLAESCTTIPARFGQIAQDGEEVSAILRRHYVRVRRELERLHAKLEMGIQAFWQTDNLFEHLIQQDRVLKGLRDRLLRKSSSVTRQEQIDLGGRLRDKLEEVRKRMGQKVTAYLQEVAVEIKIAEPLEEKMALNSLFLVKKEQQDDFLWKVEKMAGLLGEEYILKVDGPWVPFNFIEHIELAI